MQGLGGLLGLGGCKDLTDLVRLSVFQGPRVCYGFRVAVVYSFRGLEV